MTDAVVFTAGDNAQDDGRPEEYARCYAKAWGAVKDRTHPVPGNHDHSTAGAAGYVGYFGVDLVGNVGHTWYAYEVGEWRVYALDSECPGPRGCEPDSEQISWLRGDLAAHPVACVAAVWHRPRWSSGPHGSSEQMGSAWQVLYDAGAEFVVSGHDHDYERFAPQAPDGTRDDVGGMRQFVVGTGGAPLYPAAWPKPNSEVRSSAAWGILRFTLRPGGYTWEFVRAAGGSFNDAGRSDCH
jgi:acid phosphatase type 7